MGDESLNSTKAAKKGVLTNFANFTGKHLACNFIKKETLAQVLSCEFCKISKNNFFTEPLGDCFCQYHLKRSILPKCSNSNFNLYTSTISFSARFRLGYVHTLQIDFVAKCYCFAMISPHNLRNISEWIVHLQSERNNLSSPEKLNMASTGLKTNINNVRNNQNDRTKDDLKK